MTAVDAVIVTAPGSAPTLAATLESLEAAEGVDVRIHVVDNAGGAAVRAVLSGHPGIDVAYLERNVGFGAANNNALARCREDAVLLINPDAHLLDSGTLARLLAHLEDPDVAIVGCRHVDAAGEHDHNACRSAPSTRDAAVYAVARMLRLRRLAARTAYMNASVPHDRPTDVGAISGAFMLARRSALEALRGFDLAFWMYGEDLDLCARARELGWRVIYDGREIIFHAGGTSAGRVRRPRPNRAFHQALWLYYERHEPRRTLPLDALVIVGVLARYAITTASWAVSVLPRPRGRGRG